MAWDFDFFAALRRLKAPQKMNRTSGSTIFLPTPAKPPEPCMRQVGGRGLALIKRFEGCARLRQDGRFDAYPDPATGCAPWTIGWGATGPEIREGVVWTQEECDARLARDLVHFAREVAKAIADAPTTPNQFDALVSFHYNTGAIARATLTRFHAAGRYADAAAEFGKWVHAGGKKLPGLVRRRAAEAELYAGAVA